MMSHEQCSTSLGGDKKMAHMRCDISAKCHVYMCVVTSLKASPTLETITSAFSDLCLPLPHLGCTNKPLLTLHVDISYDAHMTYVTLFWGATPRIVDRLDARGWE